MVVDRIAANDSPAPRRRALPSLLAVAAYALAFRQRPGQLAADTKIDLHTDPVGFLADAAAAWAPSGGLGQVQAGQYAGYLWPMAPFHAVGDLLGLAPWVTQRLWLGTLLAVAAWGTVRLLDELLDRPRGVPHLVAGAVTIANPYVVVFANRTSVTLLAYALLPWLLLCVQRGLREPRGWWWPAALALLTTSLGAGVNAAVAGWVLLGPALLIAYEVGIGGVGGRDALRFLARALPLAALASAWWIVPVLAQVRFGFDFLPFTEPAGAIWTSTSMSESLRLMGFWVAYLGVGYGPQLSPALDTAPTLLDAPLVVAATLVVPGLALAGFAWTRRWRYGPFFAGLLLLALLVMFTGFPDGAPLRRALHYSYDRVELVRFLRTTYKAGPLLAISIACLAGVAAGVLWSRWRGRRLPAALAAIAAAVLLAGSAWPLVQGRAVDGQIAFDRVPADWERAAADVDRNLPRGTRALVLPGQVFPFYRWGGTQDAILPALTDRPVAVRGVVPYADPRAVDLLWSTDALAQGRRTLPGQLAPLIRLIGAGQVISASDDDRHRSGAVAARAAAAQLRRGAGLDEPDRRFGAVRRYAIPDSPGLVRVHSLAAPLVVDGSAGALTGLAALGGLPDDRALLYAGDLSAGELRRAARSGAEIVISDSNRRRAIVASQPRQAEGATLAAGDPLPDDAAVLDPFADRGAAAQTVAVYEGARSIRAPFSPSFVQFPEHRPYAAFDGDPGTWWSAERNFDDDRRWIEIDFGRPVYAREIELLPQREARTELRAVEIGGRRHALRPGWNRLAVELRGARRLRIAIAAVDGPPERRTRGPGAIAEVRVPGVRVRERLRPPVVASSALAGEPLRSSGLAFLFERTTGDDPFGRAPAPGPDSTSVPAGDSQSAALVAAAGDGEREITRRVTAPAARSWRADGWVSTEPRELSSPALERLAGPRGRLAAPCGSVAARVSVAGRASAVGDRSRPARSRRTAVLRMRPQGSAADLRSGRPLRAVACGPPVRLSAGELIVRSPSADLRVDLLRLRSPAPEPSAPPRPAGRVLDRGGDGLGERDGVRVALDEPARLVLAESFNRGWRAECDGRDLGEPRPVDGFANGWRAPRDCRDVRFAFAPQRAIDAGYVVSAIACAGLLVLLAVGGWRRRRSPDRAVRAMPHDAGIGAWRIVPATATDGSPRPARGSPVPLRRALAIGLAAALAGGFLFAIRAGVVIGPAVALLLWRGVGAAPLAIAAGILAGLVLPAIYLLFPAGDGRGFNSEYASDLLGAHWVAVAVWVLFALALSRAIPRRRAAAPPAADGG